MAWKHQAEGLDLRREHEDARAGVSAGVRVRAGALHAHRWRRCGRDRVEASPANDPEGHVGQAPRDLQDEPDALAHVDLAGEEDVALLLVGEVLPVRDPRDEDPVVGPVHANAAREVPRESAQVQLHVEGQREKAPLHPAPEAAADGAAHLQPHVAEEAQHAPDDRLAERARGAHGRVQRVIGERVDHVGVPL
jgi:hypothetical protein